VYIAFRRLESCGLQTGSLGVLLRVDARGCMGRQCTRAAFKQGGYSAGCAGATETLLQSDRSGMKKLTGEG
jgi:hypothetical protein